jgi:uncharacterized protein (TIGR00725 family)
MANFRVTVFGGSSPKPGEAAYIQALQLGKLLGAAGCIVQTGGYVGTMEAVSRGANEAGAHVIGITCEQIEDWRPGKLNPWVQEEIRYKTLRQRLFALIDGCDAALVLPGGIGTLTEIIFFWDELAIKASRRRPLIAIGSEWKTILDTFCDLMSSYIPDQIPGMITYAPDVKTAFSLLRQDPNWPATSNRNQ